MRQTKLDEIQREKAQETATAGSKRKEPTSDADGKPPSQDNEQGNKSRKKEPSEDLQVEEPAETQNGTKDKALAPAQLSGDQSKIDKKLKGDDVEINEANENSNNDSNTSNSEIPWHVSEKGLVYFFYRPKVRSSDEAEKSSTESLDDVQNTFMLLVPRASESDTAPAADASTEQEHDDKRKPPNPTAYRLVSLGKKRMPSPEAALKAGQEPGGIGGRHSEAIWATVAAIGADLKAAGEGMGEEHYSTKTRGKFCYGLRPSQTCTRTGQANRSEDEC